MNRPPLRALCAAVLLLLSAVQARAQEQQAGVQAELGWPPRPVLAPAAPPPGPPGSPETLQALLARVLGHDPAVRVARSLREAGEERAAQARSRLGPSVGLQVTRGGASEREFGALIDRRTDRAEATLRWNLYNQGNDWAEVQSQARELDAVAEDLRRAREEAAERIATAYAELLRWQTLLPWSEQRLATVRRLVQQTLQQNEAGKISDADAQQAQATLLDAEVAHEQLLADLQSARDSLQRLVAVEAGGTVPGVVPVLLPPPMAEPREPASGLVAGARQRAEAARERVRPLPSLLAPRIDAEYRHRLHDRTLPVATTETQYGWTVTARWDMPLLGEAQARRAEVERRAEAAAAEAERVQRQAAAELAALPARIAQATRAVVQLDRQIEQYTALVKAGELQFEAGRRTLPQLVQLHDSRFAAQQRRNEQAHRLLGAQLRQLVLTGSLLPVLGLPLE